MRQLLKALIRALAFLFILPAWVVYFFVSRIAGRDAAFPFWSQTFSIIPGYTGVYLRYAFYRLVLPRCESDVCIQFGSIFSHPDVELGRTVYIGSYCCLGAVTLENDVLLGSGVSIMNGSQQHGIDRLDIPIREQPGTWPRITVGEDTWIGDRAVIMANVGKKCVIGAGSVVTTPIPDYAIAVGSPARVLRFRNRQQDSASTQPEAR